MKRLTYILTIFAVQFYSVYVTAYSQTFQTQSGSVTFISRAPMLEFEGKSSNLTGLINIATDSLDFYIDLNTLDTGIELRNRHMRDSYLETRKFPFAEFTGTFVPSLNMGSESEQQVVARGVFTIHGVSREIDVSGSMRLQSPEIILLKAEFQVKLSDHNITIPRVVFYELSEVQTVRIQATLSRSP